jgi:hypothetical protein
MTRGQLRLQAFLQKVHGKEIVGSTETKGDLPEMVENELVSKEQGKEDRNLVAAVGSDASVLKNNGSGSKVPNGPNTTARKSEGGIFGNCADKEIMEGTSGEFEQIFASKEQSQLLARYLQKV